MKNILSKRWPILLQDFALSSALPAKSVTVFSTANNIKNKIAPSKCKINHKIESDFPILFNITSTYKCKNASCKACLHPTWSEELLWRRW